MTLDPAWLTAVRAGPEPDAVAALSACRGACFSGGRPGPELLDALAACVDGLAGDRGAASVGICWFLFDALLFVPAGLRTATGGPAFEVVGRIEAAIPRLLELRDSEDALLRAWAWHLLSWLPRPVAGVAGEALERLRSEPRALLQLTYAFAASSVPDVRARLVPLLAGWLEEGGERRKVAAMVLSHLEADPNRPETTREAAYQELLALAAGDRWSEWETAPAREHGFFADLAICIQRAGPSRATTSLPAMVRLTDACSPAELDPILQALLHVLYHSCPYDGAAVANSLSAAQRGALEALVGRPRVWLPRPGFYGALRDLGLPIGQASMAAFLGVEAPADPAVEPRSVQDGVVTLQTGRSPLEIVAALRGEG